MKKYFILVENGIPCLFDNEGHQVPDQVGVAYDSGDAEQQATITITFLVGLNIIFEDHNKNPTKH